MTISPKPDRAGDTAPLASSYPAITLWQPWGTLVGAGCKPFEFRSWPAPRSLIGRRVAIHASARKPSVAEMRALLVKLHSDRWRETGLVRETAIPLLEQWKVAPNDLPLGSVVCLATLGTPIRNAELARALGVEACDGFGTGSINDSDRNQHSNWGWPLADVEPLIPVPARGAQGWWTWRPAAHG